MSLVVEENMSTKLTCATTKEEIMSQKSGSAMTQTALLYLCVGLLFLNTCGSNIALAKDQNVRNVEKRNLMFDT